VRRPRQDLAETGGASLLSIDEETNVGFMGDDSSEKVASWIDERARSRVAREVGSRPLRAHPVVGSNPWGDKWGGPMTEEERRTLIARIDEELNPPMSESETTDDE
jgi:hypothetical protein